MSTIDSATPPAAPDTPPTSRAAGAGQMKREFTVWSAFTLAFVFVSPIVAMYGIFGLGLQTIGPAFWWGWVVTLLGQLTVAIAFGVLASRWPYAGGVYQWSRRLLGRTYGWFAGWAYSWALIIALASVAYSGAHFLAVLIGADEASTTVLTMLAIALLVVTSIVNLVGRGLVKFVATLCIAAEVLGSIGIAVWLLIADRTQPATVVFEGLAADPGTPLMMTPFMLAVAFAGWSFLGFESASSLAEEVKNPKRAVPIAIVGSLVGVALVILFTSFAIISAIPDLETVLAAGGDPVIATLAFHLPEPVVTAVLVMFVVAFLASLVGIQAAVSRVVWANAREGELPAARWLSALSGPSRMPRRAIAVVGVASILLFIPLQNEYINTLLVAFTTVGFYVAFLFPVLALAIARITRRWQPGERLFLGRAGLAIAWVALGWLLFEIVNVLWPREAPELWFVNWAPVIGAVIMGGLGWVVMRLSPAFRATAEPTAIEDAEEARP
jgi:amino acid transporter